MKYFRLLALLTSVVVLIATPFGVANYVSKHQDPQKIETTIQPHQDINKSKIILPKVAPKVVLHKKDPWVKYCAEVSKQVQAHGRDVVISEAKNRGYSDAQIKSVKQHCKL